MRNINDHNTIKVLSTLKRNEILKFKNFIHSPYFNKHKVVIKLFDALMKYYPLFTSRKLTRDRLIKLVSPTEKKSTLRDALSLLFKLLIQFIGIEEIKNNNSQLNSNVLKILSEKKLHYVYNKIYKNACVELDKLKITSLVDYFLNSFNTSQTFYDELLQIRGKRKSKLEEINIQNDIFLHLANHFLLKTFRIYYDMSTYRNIIEFDIDKLPIGKVFSANVISEMMKIIKANSKFSYIFNIYKFLLDLKVHNLGNAFPKYKKIIEKYKDKMGIDELIFHNLELMDYCIKKDTSSFEDLYYAQQLFDLYTIFLEKKMYKYISNDNSLIPDLYMNILINAIKLKKIKWLETFIKNYLNEVTASEIENLENISYAVLYNSTGQYNKSNDYAVKINEKTKIALKIRRVVIIRNNIELKRFEDALSEMDNFKALIKRTAFLSELEKQKLNTFLKLAKRIVLVELGNSKINKVQLKSEVESFKHSWFYKSWLLKKTDDYDFDLS